jgi:hypothetical protein
MLPVCGTYVARGLASICMTTPDSRIVLRGAQIGLVNEPGAVLCNELITADPAAC